MTAKDEKGKVLSLKSLASALPAESDLSKITDLDAPFLMLRNGAETLHREHKTPELTLKANTMAADFLVQNLYRIAIERYRNRFPGGFVAHTLVAVGGYGRREMAPHSDIDLLFLVSSADSAFLEALVESILYPLWDLGYKVGYAMRTPEEAITIARQDVSVWTSMLDMRYLAGDVDFLNEFRNRFNTLLLGRMVEGFLRDKWKELDERRKRFGGTVFLLEPNVKEGVGCLRDMHAIEWSIRCRSQNTNEDWLSQLGIMANYLPREIARIKKAKSLFLRIRNELHYIAGRNRDELTLQVQDTVAVDLGIGPTRTSTASEALMGKYFANARLVANLTDELRGFFVTVPRHRKALYRMTKRSIGASFLASGGELSVREGVDLMECPHLSVEILKVAAETDQRLSFSTSRKLDKLAAVKGSDVFYTNAVRNSFVTVFDSKRCGDVLDRLHVHAILPRLMREFKHLWCRMQHDAFHSYTVDIHLIRCVQVFDRFLRQIPDSFPSGTRLALSEISEFATMRIAILLHDIGKGYGKNHSVFGARLVRSIGKRFSLPKEQIVRVARLVELHLLMSDTAQRSDINDPEVISSFCSEVGDLENLNMLYILTIADQASVSESILTDWKMRLMDRLYVNARRTLETGDSHGEWAERELRDRRKLLRHEISKNPSLSKLPLKFGDRYFLTYGHQDVVDHAAFISELSGEGTAFRLVPGTSGSVGQIWMLAEDFRGLFRNTSALLYEERIHIMQIEAFGDKHDHLAFNIFHIQPEDPLFFSNEDKCERLQKRFRAVLQKDIMDLSVDVQPAKLDTWRKISNRPDKVFWDNHLVADSTVLEIHTWDRLGLIFALSETIFDLGYDIARARIDTRGNRVYDILYLQNRDGSKPSNEKDLNLLVDAIREVLGSDSETTET